MHLTGDRASEMSKTLLGVKESRKKTPGLCVHMMYVHSHFVPWLSHFYVAQWSTPSHAPLNRIHWFIGIHPHY